MKKSIGKASSEPVKTKLKVDDTVSVIAGKYKGKKGKIINIDRVRNRVLVEKINMVKKTMRKTQENQKGGILEKEAYIHISNVKYYHAGSNKIVRLGYEIQGKAKKRFAKIKNKQPALID